MSREVARGGGVGEKRLADDGELGKLNILDALLDAAGKLCEPALFRIRLLPRRALAGALLFGERMLLSIRAAFTDGDPWTPV